MALVVNTNVASITSQMYVSKTNQSMADTMERLSSGKRINSASDDAAGLAISDRLTAQVRGINQAVRNAQDGQSLIDTTEGAHQEITNILQRMRELAVQSANDTNVAADRLNLQSEVNQLVAEIDRISSQTTWNGMSLLDGTFTSKQFQIGADGGQTVGLDVDSVATAEIGAYTLDSHVNFASGSTGGIVNNGDVTISGSSGSSTIEVTAAMTAKAFASAVNAQTVNTNVSAEAVTKVKLSGMSGADTVGFTVNGTAIANTAIVDASDLRDLRDAINAISGTTGVTATVDGGSNAALILTDADGDDIKIGSFSTSGTETINITALDKDGDVAEEASATSDLTGILIETLSSGPAVADEATAFTVTGQVTLTSSKAFNTSTVHDNVAADLGSAATAGTVADGEFFGDPTTASGSSDTSEASLSSIANVSLLTSDGAKAAIGAIDGALNGIAQARADLGGLSNRLDNTISNLSNVAINVESSRSQIEDADFAAESANLAKQQIMLQAGTAMLAQANAAQQNVLSLLG